MGYEPYPSYRDSEAEWLHQVPAKWEEKRLKFSVSLINEKVDANDTDLSYLGLEHISSRTGKRIENETAESTGIAARFEKEDVLFGKLRPYLAKVLLAEENGMATTEALVLRSEDITPKFLKYYMLSQDFIDVVDGSTYGSKMPRANWEFIGNLPILLPSRNEQEQIVHFLDGKTSQLDQLIAKKQELIERLEEQRTAIITKAVTKGVDDSVKMRDSGVEWLGEVPKHWEVRRLKFLASDALQYGANEAAVMTDRDQPRFIRITDVLEDGTLDDDAFRSISEEIAEPYLLVEGDILLARSGATVGKSFKYENHWGTAAFAGYLIRFRVKDDAINQDFAYDYFKSSIYWANIDSTLIQSTIQNFSAEKYANIVLPLPPRNEQETISKYISRKLRKLDNAQVANQHMLEKLQEYRIAIITAAVTGKIDLRNNTLKV